VPKADLLFYQAAIDTQQAHKQQEPTNKLNAGRIWDHGPVDRMRADEG
jgi:hypothetical protein